LDNPDNVWRAASYAKPTGTSMDVLELTANGQQYQSNEEKAKILTTTFFPISPAIEAMNNETTRGGSREQTPEWLPLTKEEVKSVIFKSNPDKLNIDGNSQMILCHYSRPGTRTGPLGWREPRLKVE
jgi:hypothetical protein